MKTTNQREKKRKVRKLEPRKLCGVNPLDAAYMRGLHVKHERATWNAAAHGSPRYYITTDR